MKETNPDMDNFKGLCQNLENETIELIDLDVLKSFLDEAAALRVEFMKLQEEHRILKEEYRDRILGMVKATAALELSNHDTEIISRLSGDLSDIASVEMIKLYSQAAAHFRTKFPASFKYLTYPVRGGKPRNWKEYKI